MRTQSMDTHPEIERIQIELLRKASIAQHFAMIESLNRFIIEATKQSIRRDNPNLSEQEVSLILVERQYGPSLADKIRAKLEREKQQ